MMYCKKKGVVYKLHAGWFKSCTLGEFINGGLSIEFKGFSLEILLKEGTLKAKFLAARRFISPP